MACSTMPGPPLPYRLHSELPIVLSFKGHSLLLPLECTLELVAPSSRQILAVQASLKHASR